MGKETYTKLSSEMSFTSEEDDYSLEDVLEFCNFEAQQEETEVKCPYCGAQYYTINNSTSTAMYCPPVYKDGALISEDRNIITDYCTCLECHKRFTKDNKGNIKKINE